MNRKQQRLVVLSLLRDDPRRDPELSDLEAALDRILAQREEIVRLEAKARALWLALEAAGSAPAAHLVSPPWGGPLRIVRGGLA